MPEVLGSYEQYPFFGYFSYVLLDAVDGHGIQMQLIVLDDMSFRGISMVNFCFLLFMVNKGLKNTTKLMCNFV